MLTIDIEKTNYITLIYSILGSYHMSTILNIDEVFIKKFIILVEDGYDKYKHSVNIPQYHTFYHAIDVALFVHYLLCYTKIGNNLSDEHKLLLIITALLHDIGHSGLTNTYLVNSKDPLCSVYGNSSTLEKYHIEIGTKIIDETGIFDKTFKKQQYLHIIKECILATDMTFHKDYFVLQNDMDTMKIILKCADISNCCRSPEIFKKNGQTELN